MGVVLVVEDNRAYAHTVVSWLKNNNIGAYYVLSMDAAKSFLCKNEVHMVFSNSKIEKSHGIQLLEWMKIEGYYIPFFIMAEHIDIQEIVDAIKKGAENYFQKPIQTEKILSIINDVLGRKKRNTKMKQEFYYNPQNQKSRFQKRKIKKNGKRFVDSLYSLIDLKTI